MEWGWILLRFLEGVGGPVEFGRVHTSEVVIHCLGAKTWTKWKIDKEDA